MTRHRRNPEPWVPPTPAGTVDSVEAWVKAHIVFPLVGRRRDDFPHSVYAKDAPRVAMTALRLPRMNLDREIAVGVWLWHQPQSEYDRGDAGVITEVTSKEVRVWWCHRQTYDHVLGQHDHWSDRRAAPQFTPPGMPYGVAWEYRFPEFEVGTNKPDNLGSKYYYLRDMKFLSREPGRLVLSMVRTIQGEHERATHWAEDSIRRYDKERREQGPTLTDLWFEYIPQKHTTNERFVTFVRTLLGKREGLSVRRLPKTVEFKHKTGALIVNSDFDKGVPPAFSKLVSRGTIMNNMADAYAVTLDDHWNRIRPAYVERAEQILRQMASQIIADHVIKSDEDRGAIDWRPEETLPEDWYASNPRERRR